jgi:hypothetical protein
VLRLKVVGNSNFPFVTILQKLLLVVKEFLVSLCAELKVGSLHNGVHRASLLAEATVDAFGHVDIIAGRAAGIHIIYGRKKEFSKQLRVQRLVIECRTAAR